MYFNEPKAETIPEEPIIARLHRCRRLLLLYGIIDAKADSDAFKRTDAMQDRLNDIQNEEA